MKVNDSMELVSNKEGVSSNDIAHRTDFMQELAIRSSTYDHKKYGNMLVVYESDRILITLGPDYLCFIITFICFIVADYFLISYVNAAFQKFWFKLINVLFALVQLLSYLLIAVSNPGIVLQQNLQMEDTQDDGETETTIRYCLKCKVKMSKNVRHCKRCDLCIREYDHHCPWISKCVGSGNLKRFYFFVGVTPVYIIYFILMLMISSALTYEGLQRKK